MYAMPGSGLYGEAPRRASVSGDSPGKMLTLLNDRLLGAEECQTPLVEAGLDILNALKDSITRLDVKEAALGVRPNILCLSVLRCE